jgi:ABC-type sugar transport system permease subunit
VKNQRLGDNLSPYLFVLPELLLLAVFIIYPLISSGYLSMTNWSGLGAKQFIGTGNYRQLFRDPLFWNSIRLQLIWAVMSLVFLAISALLLALIVEMFVPRKGLTSVFRTILFMPMMMSLVSVGLLWTMIYHPIIGVINGLLNNLGILKSGQVLTLLANPKTTLYAVFVPVIWQWSGFGMVIFSAAMQGIPQDIIEASVIDGCSKLSRIRHIILPLLAPTIVTVNTVNFIGGLKCFDIIYVMTDGGPGYATLVTSIYIFKKAFINNEFGYSAAASLVLFLFTTLFGLVFLKINRSLDVYI